jgi:hypothetical protein
MAIAEALGENPDELFARARKLPRALAPQTAVEVALYRRMKNMTTAEKPARHAKRVAPGGNTKSDNGDDLWHESMNSTLRREQGDYAVRRPGSGRASDVAQTQAEAIEHADEIDPKAAIHVERVRDTSVGGRDKWRKP